MLNANALNSKVDLLIDAGPHDPEDKDNASEKADVIELNIVGVNRAGRRISCARKKVFSKCRLIAFGTATQQARCAI